MKSLSIQDKSVVSEGNQSITDKVMGVTLTNTGAASVFYSWNGEDKSIELTAGESIAFGGSDNYTLGGNKLFYEFGTVGNKKLQITLFTINPEPVTTC